MVCDFYSRPPWFFAKKKKTEGFWANLGMLGRNIKGPVITATLIKYQTIRRNGKRRRQKSWKANSCLEFIEELNLLDIGSVEPYDT